MDNQKGVKRQIDLIFDCRFKNSKIHLSAMVDYGGRPIILAGQGVYDPYHNHAEYYNGLSWVDFVSLPINVRYHSAVTNNKYIWVFGGYYYRLIASFISLSKLALILNDNL